MHEQYKNKEDVLKKQQKSQQDAQEEVKKEKTELKKKRQELEQKIRKELNIKFDQHESKPVTPKANQIQFSNYGTSNCVQTGRRN